MSLGRKPHGGRLVFAPLILQITRLSRLVVCGAAWEVVGPDPVCAGSKSESIPMPSPNLR
jgi:hypothetical protein